MFHCEERPKIEQYCSFAGFHITKSYDTHSVQLVFQTIESLLNWISSTAHGVSDPKLVTEERLQRCYPTQAEKVNLHLTSEEAKTNQVFVDW